MFYNRYHRQNKHIQAKVISKRNITYASILRFIKKHVTKTGATVLDIGCGVGTVDFYLAQQGFTVTGIDISNRAITLAKQSAHALNLDTQTTFINANIDTDPVTFSPFDYILCSEVIEHVENDQALLKKIHTLLKADGLVILTTPLKEAPLKRWGLLEKFDRRVGHVRRYSQKEIIQLVKSSGFQPVEIKLTEGVVRNSLYTLPGLGWLVRFFKWPLSAAFHLVDTVSIHIFGPSNIYLACKKNSPTSNNSSTSPKS
jgi:SAM-dependent methyltransferase